MTFAADRPTRPFDPEARKLSAGFSLRRKKPLIATIRTCHEVEKLAEPARKPALAERSQPRGARTARGRRHPAPQYLVRAPAWAMSERMFHVKHLAEERMAAAKRMLAPGARCGPPSRIRGSGAEAGPRRGSAGREPRMSRALGRRARRSSERKRFVRLARAWL